MNNESFTYWKKLYDGDKLEEFNFNSLGLLWLKIKSIIRKELINDFLTNTNIELDEKTLSGQFIELYNLLSQTPESSHQVLDNFIKQKSEELKITFNYKGKEQTFTALSDTIFILK